MINCYASHSLNSQRSLPQGSLVIGNQLFLLFFGLAPVATGTHEIRLDPAFRARSDYLVLKLLLLSPLANAVQTVIRWGNEINDCQRMWIKPDFFVSSPYQKQCEQLGNSPKRCFVEGNFSQMISMQIPHALSRDLATANDFSMSNLCWSKQSWKKRVYRTTCWNGEIMVDYLIVFQPLRLIRRVKAMLAAKFT